MPWQPLLDGDLAERARDSVQAIVADLAPSSRDLTDGASLAGGMAGQAILHGYRARNGCTPDAAVLAADCLRQATEAMTATATTASLYAGLTGVGWALAHLKKGDANLFPSDPDADLAEIDELLLEHLAQSPWREDYDLISGLVGLGVYALERLPEPAAVACLEGVIAHLEATAEHCPDGLRWWTSPDWLPEETRETFPRGYYNVGLAHGVPGVVAFLGHVCQTGVAADRARPLLDGAVGWMLAQDAPAGFSYWIAPDDPGEDRSRLAWCYGDPGVAAALLGVARRVNEPEWAHRAIAVARRAAARPHDQSGVVDAGLCHGAAGLGHLFNRMFQATGAPDLAVAARFWFERTLAMRRPGHGVGGYEAWLGGDDGKPAWVADAGLLTGSTGIALALLGAITTVEPAWDRMLLVDVPSSARQP